MRARVDPRSGARTGRVTRSIQAMSSRREGAGAGDDGAAEGAGLGAGAAGLGAPRLRARGVRARGVRRRPGVRREDRGSPGVREDGCPPGAWEDRGPPGLRRHGYDAGRLRGARIGGPPHRHGRGSGSGVAVGPRIGGRPRPGAQRPGRFCGPGAVGGRGTTHGPRFARHGPRFARPRGGGGAGGWEAPLGGSAARRRAPARHRPGRILAPAPAPVGGLRVRAEGRGQTVGGGHGTKRLIPVIGTARRD